MSTKDQTEKHDNSNVDQKTHTGDASASEGAGQVDEQPPYDVSWETLSVPELREALKIGSECGCNPRDARRGHAHGIAEAIDQGELPSGLPDIVCLCEHGGISNGRHRALAAVEVGVPLTGWVGRNVPKEIIRYADIGLKRTPADALKGRGVESYRAALGAAVRLLRLYDTKRDIHWSLWSKVRFTAPKIGDLFDNHYSDLEAAVEAGRQIESGTNCTPSAAVAFAYLVRREGGAERLAQVAYGLAGGTPDVKDVLAVTRTRLSREARQRGRKADHNRAPYEMGLMITAVMAREAGRKGFKFGDASPMPTLVFSDHLMAEAV